MKMKTVLIIAGSIFILFSGVLEALALSQGNSTTTLKSNGSNNKPTNSDDKLTPSNSPGNQIKSNVFTQEQVDKVYKMANMEPPASTKLPQGTPSIKSESNTDNLSWIIDMQKDLENFNTKAIPKELANSAIVFSKKWSSKADKAHSDAFFGKKANSDDLFSLSSKISSLKRSGNWLLDQIDNDGQGKDFFIKSYSDDIKATITQLKRISSQLIN
jgi:hypothetical protein